MHVASMHMGVNVMSRHIIGSYAVIVSQACRMLISTDSGASFDIFSRSAASSIADSVYMRWLLSKFGM